MQRLLTVQLCLMMLACSSKSSEPGEAKTPPSTAATIASQSIAPDKVKTLEATVAPGPTEFPPGMEEFAGLVNSKRSGPIAGEVEYVASLKAGFIRLLHDVNVSGGYAYVSDAGGMIYRVATSGGEFEIVHDSDNGAGTHAGFLCQAATSIYFMTDDFEGQGELMKVEGDSTVAVTHVSDLLELAGDESHLFATRFQKKDIHKLGEGGFEFFVKASRPQSPVIAGTHLYWTSYRPGGVYRVLLSGKKEQRVAKATKPIGLAVVGDTVFYGTESDGAIYAVPTTGGVARRIADGFDNHDSFVADDAGIYFWTWGHPGAVLRLDAKTHKIETMLSGLNAPRGLAIEDGWLYVVEGPDLMRVRTDARMPWPVKPAE